MARTGSSEHLRYRYGICLNDKCSKCKTKEVQTIAARKDFVCEECGKSLRECPPPTNFMQKYGKLIGISIAAVVVIGGGIAAALSFSDDNVPENTVVVEAKEDSTTMAKEPVLKDTIDNVKASTEVTVTEKPVKTPPYYDMGYGKFEGSQSGGTGVGIIKVTRHYTLDLKKASGETLELNPGDQIVNAVIKGGKLKQGELRRKDGTRRTISGL